jgi:Arc/MetJ-type ribon-helix-helix transcriptional regulator
MTIHLPHDLERSIHAAVHVGRFASVDDAMAKAVRLLLHEMGEKRPSTPAEKLDVDPVLGCMQDDAALMDDIVADAYRRRSEETWRELDL